MPGATFKLKTNLFKSWFQCSKFQGFTRRHFPALQPTSERLGAGGGYDTVHAGHKRSYSHCTFRGATPPLVPNRQLGVRHFSRVLSLFTSLSDCTQFSGCTTFSEYCLFPLHFRAALNFQSLVIDN